MNGILASIWLLCFCGGPYLIFQGITSFRRQRLIEDCPTVKSSVAAFGRAEFQGYVYPSQNIIGPVSNKPLAFLKLTLSIRVTRFRTRKVSYLFAYPFFLADEMGCILVMPVEKMEFSIKRRTEFLRSLKPENMKLVREIVDRHFPAFVKRTNEVSQMLVIEEAIYCGEPVYAFGHFQNQKGASREMIQASSQALGAMRERFSNLAIEERWKVPHGVLTNSAENRLFIADCWESELLARIGSNIGLIISGAFLFATSLAVAAIYLAR